MIDPQDLRRYLVKQTRRCKTAKEVLASIVIGEGYGWEEAKAARNIEKVVADHERWAGLLNERVTFMRTLVIRVATETNHTEASLLRWLQKNVLRRRFRSQRTVVRQTKEGRRL